MTDFFSAFACAYIGAAFLTSGIYHLVGIRSFVRNLRRHRVLPESLQTLSAVGVPASELALSCGAVMIAVQGSMITRAAIFVLSAAAGGSFLVYLRALLRKGSGDDCGCLPLRSPLTPVSLFPAAAIIGVSVAGAAATLGGGSPIGDNSLLLLPAAWGVTLACLAPLFPATMPPLRGQIS
jgi:hypothetical protein